jgi:hypothetical protein
MKKRKMKTQLLKMTLLAGIWIFSFAGLKAQTQESDSVMIIDTSNNQKVDTVEINIGKSKIIKVIIIKNEPKKDSASVETKIGKEGNEFKSDRVWAGVHLGINGFMGPRQNIIPDAPYDFMELNMPKSIGVQLNLWEERINLISNRVNLITGLGLEWNNYRFAQNVSLARAENYPDVNTQTPVFGYHDSSRNYIKSKLATSSLNVPLLLNVCSKKTSADDKQFNLSVGVIGSLRYNHRTKAVFKDGQSRTKEVDKSDFGINPFALQGTVRMKYGWFNLFANYSLTPLFLESKGPELYPFSVGLALVSF